MFNACNLKAGACVSVASQNAGASVGFLSEVAAAVGVTCDKANKKNKNKDPSKSTTDPTVPAAQVQPKTKLEHAESMLKDILNESGEARTYAVQLDGHEFAESLVAKLLDHAAWLDKAYKVVNAAVINKNWTVRHDQLLLELAKRTAWYKIRKDVAAGMSKALKPKAVPKAKAKAVAK